MKRLQNLIRALLVVFALGSLLPLAPFVWDWIQVAQSVSIGLPQPTFRGYDWAQWEYIDGRIQAVYVVPGGTAYEAGIRNGDVLTELDYRPFFEDEAFKIAIEAIQPGQTHAYTILRGNGIRYVEVKFTAYPIFLYPLSAHLWMTSVWGFFIVAFIHFMALAIIAPIRTRSAKTWLSLWLIIASSVAVLGNFIRILLLQVVGAAYLQGISHDVFQILSLICLLGWIAFPAVLLHKVLFDREAIYRSLGRVAFIVYAPAVLFAFSALVSYFIGGIGPITFRTLLPPVLYYVYFYIAAATGLNLLLPRLFGQAENESTAGAPAWSNLGSFIIFVVSTGIALAILLISRILSADYISDIATGWIILMAQLMTTAPILLVSLATLKYGKVDEVISQYLAYAMSLGLCFFAFVAGATVLEPIYRIIPQNLVAGFLAVCLIIGFGWLFKRIQLWIRKLIAADRATNQRNLIRFGEQMISIVDHKSLIQKTLNRVVEGLHATSGALFLKPASLPERWESSLIEVKTAFTESEWQNVWAAFQNQNRVWAQNPELNERDLPRALSLLLKQSGFELALPIPGRDQQTGLLLLGPKKHFRTVYNLGEIELLRTLANQLGLANERISLIEREKDLIKQHAEAQLVALRAQINPHFLFNALNTLAALIDENPQEAERCVEHLAAIFRYILRAGSKTFATLEEEFSLVGHYLAIEQTRFGPSLVIEQFLDQAARMSPVPAFAVQTLVENAIKHGLERNRRRGTLRLHGIAHPDGSIEIVVQDTGFGIPVLFGNMDETTEAQPFFGIGLQNVSARLVHLYGRSDLLRYRSEAEAGTTVRMLIPPSEQATETATPHNLAYLT